MSKGGGLNLTELRAQRAQSRTMKREQDISMKKRDEEGVHSKIQIGFVEKADFAEKMMGFLEKIIFPHFLEVIVSSYWISLQIL